MGKAGPSPEYLREENRILRDEGREDPNSYVAHPTEA